MENPEGKKCGRCDQQLPLTAFGKRQAAKDGLQHWCRACFAEWASANRPRKMAIAPAVPEGHKWCRGCGETKPVADFAAHASRPDGRQVRCRACQADAYRQKQLSRGAFVRPKDIPPGHKFCRACQRVLPLTAWARRMRSTDGYSFRCRECIREHDREKTLLAKYGLTSAEVDALRDSQGGLCAICRSAPAVHVDHDHKTGRVRGMCCFSCNAALGHFRDDPRILRRAARYLEGRHDRRPQRTVQKHGLTYEILLSDVFAPLPGESGVEAALRGMLAVSGSRVELIRFETEATASDATEGTP